MRIKILLLPLLSALVGCDWPNAGDKVEKDYSYCLESDNSYDLPRIGDVKLVSVEFSVFDQIEKDFNASAKCEYKA